MRTLLGTLTPEELAEYRDREARMFAMRIKPDEHSRDNVAAMASVLWGLQGRFLAARDVPPATDLQFDLATGHITGVLVAPHQ